MRRDARLSTAIRCVVPRSRVFFATIRTANGLHMTVNADWTLTAIFDAFPGCRVGCVLLKDADDDGFHHFF